MESTEKETKESIGKGIVVTADGAPKGSGKSVTIDWSTVCPIINPAEQDNLVNLAKAALERAASKQPQKMRSKKKRRAAAKKAHKSRVRNKG